MVLVVPVVGGEALELVEGTEPAWSPDGEWIYFVRPDGIWRIASAGGAMAPIEGTAAGADPAVSPDGTELAFTRIGEGGKGDIWVVPLP
jgi:TolB protein